MKNALFNRIKYCFKNIFSSQDSKYYIVTSLKFSSVPILSFIFVAYSLWNVLGINFIYFKSQGFDQGPDVFYDQIFINISQYALYFLINFFITFMFGLYLSYLALRALDEIEEYSFLLLKNINTKFKINKFNKNKLIYQVARIFFRYIKIYVKRGKVARFNLPEQLLRLKKPPRDKVFLTQYLFIVIIVSLSSSTLLYAFINDLFQELFNTGLQLLPKAPTANSFLNSQENILLKIYSIAIFINCTCYFLISKSIIKTIDGVSFGFARDMIKVVKGQHSIRLAPRTTDPGQGIAAVVNEIIESVFPSKSDQRSLEQAITDTITEMEKEEEFQPKFCSVNDLNTPPLPNLSETDYNTLERSGSEVLTMLMRGESSELKEDTDTHIPPVSKKTKKY